MSEEKMNQKDLVAKTFNNDAIAEVKTAISHWVATMNDMPS